MLEELRFHPETSPFSKMVISDNCIGVKGKKKPTKQLLFPTIGRAEKEVANGDTC